MSISSSTEGTSYGKPYSRILAYQFPPQTTAQNGSTDYEEIDVKKEPDDEQKLEDDDDDVFIRPSLRDDAPLAGILHPSLDNVDPKLFFKDYKRNGVLRFSRIFAANIKPSSKPEIWWPSKTFYKKKKANHEPSNDGSLVPEKKKLKLEIVENPTLDKLRNDQEEALIRSTSSEQEATNAKKNGDEVVQPWRVGPAKIWYDMMNLPSTSTNVNYGFRLMPKSHSTSPPRPTASTTSAAHQPSTSRMTTDGVDRKIETNDDMIYPYKLVEWEKKVLLDGDHVKQRLNEIVKELTNERTPGCGWVPTQFTRTFEHFLHAEMTSSLHKVFDPEGSQIPIPHGIVQVNEQYLYPSTTHSIFPAPPSDLDLHNWEDDVIWDPDAMPENPEPIMLMVDFNDDPLIFGMPEDKRTDDDRPDRKENQYTKKSKMILGQVQQRQKQEEEEQMESSMAQFTDNDPFNLSNDDYYVPKGTSKTLGCNSLLIQHSTPAQNIHRTFFPTHLGPYKLRHWHRLTLSRKLLRFFASNRFTQICTVTKHMNRMREIREKMKAAEGGGDIFFMRDVADLSGRDGDLIMIEYSEEHPVILSQPGMSSKLKNYYKRKPGNDMEPTFDFGEMAFSHQVPFLGQLQPGQSLQSLENNMYRAPIFRHTPKPTDFLLMRNKNSWYIRKCPALFVAGQQCPLIEVPSPNSKRATVFVRDFLLAYIFRLFWASDHVPRRLKMDDIRVAFPQYAESSVRKRLKQCSQFTRLGPGPDQSYWVLKPDFRLPTKEEVLAMVTPEMCCAQYSMLAAEQRLKDAGYGEKYFFTPENEEGSDDEVTIEDEIKCAPWNTTRAFLASQRDKCLLDQTGIADPTGCGQGFSYVRVSQKPHKEDMPPVPKKLVTGTNADLRKLPLKEAKAICREYGVKEEEINALSRWEIIDVIRTLSTQAAKASKEGENTHEMARFARGNTRFSSADMQEKYRKHCQRIFDLQNHTLSNPDALSTDDDTSDEDSDNEELASRIEQMVQEKGKKNIAKSKERMEFEDEEKERQDLKRMIHGDTVNKTGEKKEVTAEEKKNASKIGEDVAMSASKISGITANQKLKIYRTLRNEDGTESTRVEVVTRPQLIEAYTRIRMTRDDTFIQVYAQMDEQYKEEKRKQKRRLQDQLRRIKKNEEKQLGRPPKNPGAPKKEVPIKPSLIKMRCSACQGTGHMKTNRNCPLYGKEPLPTVGEEPEEPTSLGEILFMEGTKIKINKRALMNMTAAASSSSTPSTPTAAKKSKTVSRVESIAHDEQPPTAVMSPMATRAENGDDDDGESLSMVTPSTPAPAALRASRNSSVGASKRRSSMMPEEDYLHGPVKNIHRLRADPRVTMSTLLTEIFNEMKAIPGADHHLVPVNAKKVPDYYTIIKNPMDLQKIKKKISDQVYELRKDFLADVKQMLDNSRLYNGDNNIITVAAQQMLELAGKRMCERDEKFIALEKQINPLLDDNDTVGFSHLLCEIVQRCKNVPKSAMFHTPVDHKKWPFYHLRVPNPMDLGTIEKNAKQRKYSTVAEFRKDVEQIFKNSEIFNGPAETNPYTMKAREILAVADQLLEEKREQLAELEANINNDGATILDESMDDEMDDVKQEVSIDMGVQESVDEMAEQEMSDVPDEMEETVGDGMPPMDDEDSMMWDDGLSGQVINDLALSDSDEEERLDDLRRANNDDDNRLDSF
ncbi:unnamed protein product [Caenorhabditis bovis]|uniref:Bromo domain-containing protein n=1 Tax=Caenorhabditis bovis TaxID=2654633 RepID=A0A8S1F399_9PELO|nr:unnamed protein product [Caenorhabditis bovis]